MKEMAKEALSSVMTGDSPTDVAMKAAELEFCVSRQLAPFVLSSDPLDFYLSGQRQMVQDGEIEPGRVTDNLRAGLQICRAIEDVLSAAGELIPHNEEDGDLRDPAEIVASVVYDPYYSPSFMTIVLAGGLHEDVGNGDLNALVAFASFVSEAGGFDLMRFLYNLIPALERLNNANIQLFEELLARLDEA
jgi:hypothetical protein